MLADFILLQIFPKNSTVDSHTSRPLIRLRGWNCDPQFFTRNLTNERWARQYHALLSEVRVHINGLVRSFAHFQRTEYLRVHRPFSFGFTRVCTCNPRGVYRPPSYTAYTALHISAVITVGGFPALYIRVSLPLPPASRSTLPLAAPRR